jgi:hypothetical protein
MSGAPVPEDFDAIISEMLRTALRRHRRGEDIRDLVRAIDTVIARKRNNVSGPPLRGGRQIRLVR